MAESGAIIEYLLETYGQGRFVPAEPEHRRRYRYWLHYAEGSLMPWLVIKLVFSRIPQSPDMPFFLRPVAKKMMAKVQTQFLAPQLSTHLGFIEASLQGQDWFAGGLFRRRYADELPLRIRGPSRRFGRLPADSGIHAALSRAPSVSTGDFQRRRASPLGINCCLRS